MRNTRSRLEKCLAHRFADMSPLARPTAGGTKIDFAYLDEGAPVHLINDSPE